ncbi:hypothetical protein GKA92_18285 [Salmonella enterica subsp. enterica]|nr:hypothetical protein [Salmonella enterica subsp. enterica serovar Abaetetuba]
MFNVKRNGSNVEITGIPASISFAAFKSIADETGANECLVTYLKDKDSYEVVIRHDSANMAGTAAWLALEQQKYHDQRNSQKDGGEASKYEMNKKRVKMLRVMPVLDRRISEILEENGIPGVYSLDAVRLLLAVYEETNDVIPDCDFPDPFPDF